MKKQIEQLKEFHKAYKLPDRETPEIVPQSEFVLRHRLLEEEVQELFDAYIENDLIEVTDSICDIMYIIIGTAVQFGIASKIEECFNEVHRSNMSKLDGNGNPIYREDGKVLKGNFYSPPDLKSILYRNEKESV